MTEQKDQDIDLKAYNVGYVAGYNQAKYDATQAVVNLLQDGMREEVERGNENAENA